MIASVDAGSGSEMLELFLAGVARADKVKMGAVGVVPNESSAEPGTDSFTGGGCGSV